MGRRVSFIAPDASATGRVRPEQIVPAGWKPALLEKFQKQHVGDEAGLRIAADGLADVQPQQSAVRSDRLPRDSHSLERRVAIAGEAVGQQPLVVIRLHPKLIGEDEAVRKMAEKRFFSADRARADAVNALGTEEAELVFSKAIEALAVEVIQLDTDALKLRQIKTLRQLTAEVGERLLIRVVLREESPRFPVRACVVIVEAGDGVAPPRILRVDSGTDH